MRTGIYGGTFNPIHTAHVHLLREFSSRLALDRVILIPTGTPPHKVPTQLAADADRLAMCKIVAAEMKSCPVLVSDIEMRRAGKSFTADTLTQLRALYPEDEFFLLMGEDMFMTVERWFHPEVIFRQATICGAPRDYGSFPKMIAHGEDIRKNFSDFSFILLNIPYIPVSSTHIRKRLLDNMPLQDLVTASVENYIRERGLYQNADENS